MTFAPLTGKQLQAVRLATAGGNILEGAVRSAKTVASVLWWLDFVRNGPAGDLLMIGKTERTLRRNIIGLLQQMLGARRCRYKMGLGELDLMGRTIYTVGANNELAVDKIRGMTLAGWYGDELTTWPQSFFDMARTRLSVPGAKWIGTCNPASSNHWLMTEHLSKASLHLDHDGQLVPNTATDAFDLHRFSFTLYDNPHLTSDYMNRMERENTGVFFQRNIRGLWVAAEGTIYPTVPVVDKLPYIVRWVSLGIDYGTTNPTHAVLVGLGADGVLYVAGEWRASALTDAEYSTALRAWLRTFQAPDQGEQRSPDPSWITIDPAAASFRMQLYRDAPHLPVTEADNAVVDGIRVIASLFAVGALRVHASCTHLLAELDGYVWDPKASERGSDAPMKVDDHGPDALRYALYTTRGDWTTYVKNAPALLDAALASP